MIPITSEPWIFDILGEFYIFVTFAVFLALAVGLASRSMAVGSLSGYITFAYIASETGDELLGQILTVTLVLVFIGFAFKFWRLEGMGEGS